MTGDQPETLLYRRALFVTALPVDCLYTSAHAWLKQTGMSEWRVGLTKFATRMLGEMVDYALTTAPGTVVRPGDVIGWVEGFKATSDLFCAAAGEFLGGNPALEEKLALIHSDPHGAGWIYQVRGQPDGACFDVHGYRRLLDQTIDRLRAQRHSGVVPPGPPAGK
jgi:glycine cleavage system H protein